MFTFYCDQNAKQYTSSHICAENSSQKKKKNNKTHPLSQGVEGALGSAWEILEAR